MYLRFPLESRTRNNKGTYFCASSVCGYYYYVVHTKNVKINYYYINYFIYFRSTIYKLFDYREIRYKIFIFLIIPSYENF